MPLADWDKVVEEHRKMHNGNARGEMPGQYPTPGRIVIPEAVSLPHSLNSYRRKALESLISWCITADPEIRRDGGPVGPPR